MTDDDVRPNMVKVSTETGAAWRPAIMGPLVLPCGVIDEIGRLTILCIDKDGARCQIDLTTEIERIAKEAVAEHMRKWHSHQI